MSPAQRSPNPLSPTGEGVVMGAALSITLYGIAAIIAGAALGRELIPHTVGLAVGLLVAIMVVGGLVGRAIDVTRSRARG